MRLSEKEVHGICKALAVKGDAKLYLYGSRVKDDLKGGDIDLLLIVDEAEDENLNLQKHILLRKMKENIGDRKIDLTITTLDHTKSDPFLTSAMKSAILIHAWG